MTKDQAEQLSKAEAAGLLPKGFTKSVAGQYHKDDPATDNTPGPIARQLVGGGRTMNPSEPNVDHVRDALKNGDNSVFASTVREMQPDEVSQHPILAGFVNDTVESTPNPSGGGRFRIPVQHGDDAPQSLHGKALSKAAAFSRDPEVERIEKAWREDRISKSEFVRQLEHAMGVSDCNCSKNGRGMRCYASSVMG